MLIKGAKWQIGLLAYMPTFEMAVNGEKCFLAANKL